MTSDLAALFVLVGGFSFLLHWVVAGTILAVVLFSRPFGVKKTLFGAFFTLFSALVGAGSAVLGLHTSPNNLSVCLLSAENTAEFFAFFADCTWPTLPLCFLLSFTLLVIGSLLVLQTDRFKGEMAAFGPRPVTKTARSIG